MARGNQTFQKRQRENKLRERAQQKRERREQRKSEKKQSQVPPPVEPEHAIESTASAENPFGGDP